jgi:hypothetical protein
VSAHDLVEVIDLGWQATGFSTPPVYRLDGRCSCGQVATTTAPAGEVVARQAIEGLHKRHVFLAVLEDRIAVRFTGQRLTESSNLRLTERAARRFAALAIEEFLRPPDPAP